MSTKRALVAVAHGSEDIETTIIVDILRRAAVHIDLAAATPDPSDTTVTLARGCRLVADMHISSLAGASYDLIACPGGMPGATNLASDATLTKLLQAQKASGRLVAAVCAAPAVVLVPAGIIGANTRATAHANFAAKLPNQSAVTSRVVVDGNVITSRGPGTSIEFALQCVASLLGHDKAQEVAAPLHLPEGLLQLV